MLLNFALFTVSLLSIRLSQGSSAIHQGSFVEIGGIKQWVAIDGENIANPVVLVVHGGPGEAQWPAAAKFVPWQRRFTVVQWDQRGAGHTFGLYGEKTPDVNLSRIARDGLEVAHYLRRKLHKKKIIVLGHSWGTIVATKMVQTDQKQFAAYVGTGQVASWEASVTSQFDLLLAKAKHDGDKERLAELEAIGRPNPQDTDQYFRFSRTLRSVLTQSDQGWFSSLRASLPKLAANHPKQLQNLESGMQFTEGHVLPDQVRSNLPATARVFGVAFFVVQGSEDRITPTQAARAYYNGVVAPFKSWTCIPNAGHFAWMTSPEAFLRALNTKVRQVAIRRGA
jgi:pimeloyl-ACP methyl ester carboxylesterase